MTQEQKSLGELFSDLTAEMSSLVRNEIQLAKTELTQKAALAGRSAGMIVAAGLMAFLGLEGLLAAAIVGLATAMPTWAAALVVGGVLLAIAAVLAWKAASNLRAENLAPRKTIESLQEDAQWAKQQIP